MVLHRSQPRIQLSGPHAFSQVTNTTSIIGITIITITVTATRFPSNPWSYEACATPSIGSYSCPAAYVAAPTVIVAPSDHVHVSAPLAVVPDHGHGLPNHVHVSAPSHAHVAAPLVVAVDPVHSHVDRNEIPQGPFLHPILKKADTAFPTK